ncbi:MAG TPA: hypothetical protein VM055_02195 [Novosphingobium sp.]|nr:hypothetical protein [Novosphingobium sp.]
MQTLLASLVFATAALAALGVIAATWTRYRDVALGHVAALRAVDEARDFRVRIVGQARLPVLAGHPGVRRLPHRAAAARRFATLSGVRAAA